jgi:hypothetical protein
MTSLAAIVRDARAEHSGLPAVREGDPTGKIPRREVRPPAGDNA